MHDRRTHLWALLLGAGASLLTAGAAHAQEVHWRTDYNVARKEAKEKGLPLVLDIGTDNCLWCRKLEETTFRDPVVAGTLTKHFVALKINAEREPALANHLRITQYPTVVLADADGKILGTMEGYQEAGRFQENLQRALASIANPEWMLRDYQEALKAYGAPDYPQAVTLLKRVLADGKGRPVQEKARQMLGQIEKQAAGKLARARQLMDKGESTEATAVLTEVVRLYPGTTEAADAGQMLTRMVKNPEVRTQQREQRARELLAQAKEDYRTRQYLCCLDRCEILTATFGDLQEGAEAVQLSAEIKSNPEWMQSACESLTERLSTMYLALAETWLQKGQPQQARLCLERVISTFPGSRQAEVAQVRLAQIQGQPPTRPVDFQKQ
jgi:thioredoxin-like negative regulator of GroEL